MKLYGLTFENWLMSHTRKSQDERWLRELYPWPVFAKVDFDRNLMNVVQKICHDDVEYRVTIETMRWQPEHGTSKFAVLVQSEGLGWHSRAFDDRYYVCARPDGEFVTLFHSDGTEPLERVARRFFGRQWDALDPEKVSSLSTSRFLSACLVSRMADRIYEQAGAQQKPLVTLVGGQGPMFVVGDQWVGYRFFSEDAFAWARRSAKRERKVCAWYIADTKYPFRTDLPRNATVRSLTDVDANDLDGEFRDLIRILVRGLKLPPAMPEFGDLDAIVHGRSAADPVSVTEGDVQEALAALKRPCHDKDELRYQLAAGVVLNAWIDGEVRRGLRKRKKFYAFKAQIGALARWATESRLPQVTVWTDGNVGDRDPIVYIRVDDVDFSFHAIPDAHEFEHSPHVWAGVRLKPIAPFVLAWAASLLDRGPAGGERRTRRR